MSRPDTVVDEAKARRGRLWQAILARFDEIAKQPNRGTSRSAAWYSDDGKCAARATVYQMDGTAIVYWIEAQVRGFNGQFQLGYGPRTGEVDVRVSESWHSNEPYWEDLIAKDADGRGVVIEGVHYRLGQNGDRPGPYNGFAGTRYDIEFDDGRRVTTHDLWYQGPVPPKFRDRLPDNARFVQPAPVVVS